MSADFARAADQLLRGRPGAADGWCRRGLEAAPEDPAGLNLLGCIAASVDLREQAAAAFRRALPLPAAAANLALLDEAGPVPARSGPGFVLIKAWGYGFCAELAHLLGGLLLAGITGRTPLVQWGERSLFGPVSGFFEPVSEATLADLAGASLFPAGWTAESLERDRPVMRPGQGPGALEFLARTEPVLVCDHFLGPADLAPWIPAGHRLAGLSLPACIGALWDACLKPRPEILEAVAAFRARHLDGAPVLALHLRGSDKVLELPDLAEANRRCLERAGELPPGWRLFLMTDDDTLARAVRRRFGDRVVMTGSRRSRDATGIHYQGADGAALGREMLIDLLLALGADRFIGNGRSNVAALIAILREAAGRESELVLDNQLLHHSCFL